MKLLILTAVIFLAGGMSAQISPGGNINVDTYSQLALDSNIFPNEAQFLYYAGGSEFQNNLQIYGDGTILISIMILDRKGKPLDLCCYAIDEEPDVNEGIMNNIINLGYLSFECNDVIDVPKCYYSTLRVEDDYYFNLHFMGEEAEEPDWYVIIEYLDGIIEEYSVEDNRKEPTEYLDIKSAQEETYGYCGIFSTYYIEKYVSEAESE